MGLYAKVKSRNDVSVNYGKPTSVQENHLINTEVDEILKHIKKNKKIKIKELSKLLGLSVLKLEYWLYILTEKNLVKIHYPLIGYGYVSENIVEKDKKKIVISKNIRLLLFTVSVVLVVVLLIYILTMNGILFQNG